MSLPYSNTANQPFGGIVITIGGIARRALNFAPNLNTREIRRNDVNGDRAEFQLREEPVNATVTLQENLSTSTPPAMGATFAVDGRNYVVTSVTKAKPEGDFWTIDVGYTDATGPGSTTIS